MGKTGHPVAYALEFSISYMLQLVAAAVEQAEPLVKSLSCFHQQQNKETVLIYWLTCQPCAVHINLPHVPTNR